MLKIYREEIIRFYDHQSTVNKDQSNSISTLAGEDLGLALLCHYLRFAGYQANIVSYKCKAPGNKGHRLDAWVSREGTSTKTLFQTEVKNWCAHSLNSEPLDINASPQVVQSYKIARWSHQWVGGIFREAGVNKVLEPMTPPAGYADWEISPLVCYWYPIHPSGGGDFFFKHPVTHTTFSSVYVFSMSAYLRSLSDDALELVDMPRAEQRIKTLSRLFRISGAIQ